MKNNVYNVGGGCLRIGIKLFTIPLLIHALGLENYGIWILVTSVIESLLIVEAGLSVPTTVFLAKEFGEDLKEEIQETLTIVVAGIALLSAVAGFIMVFVVPELSFMFRKLDEAQVNSVMAALGWCALVLVGRMFQQVCSGVQQARLRYAHINIINTFQTLVLSIGLVIFAQRGHSIADLMIWYFSVTALFLLVHLASAAALLKGVALRPRIGWTKTAALARYSMGAWGSALGSVMFAHFDKVLIGSVLGPSVLAIYGFTTSVCAQINSVSAMAVQPMLPVLSGLLTEGGGRTREVAREIRKAVALNCLVALALSALLVSIAPWLLGWLIPQAAGAESVFAFRIAAVIYGVYSLNAVGFYLLYALHQVAGCMAVQLLSGMASLVAIYGGAIHMGLLGAVVGNGAYWLVWGLTVLAMRAVGLPPRTWSSWFALPIGAFVLLAVPVFVLPDSPSFVAAKIICALAMYSLFTVRFFRYNVGSNHG